MELGLNVSRLQVALHREFPSSLYEGSQGSRGCERGIAVFADLKMLSDARRVNEA